MHIVPPTACPTWPLLRDDVHGRKAAGLAATVHGGGKRQGEGMFFTKWGVRLPACPTQSLSFAVVDLLKGLHLGPARALVAGAVGGFVGSQILQLLIPALRGFNVVPIVGCFDGRGRHCRVGADKHSASHRHRSLKRPTLASSSRIALAVGRWMSRHRIRQTKVSRPPPK